MRGGEKGMVQHKERRTFDYTINTAKESCLDTIETELCDNQLTLISELRCISTSYVNSSY
jgi:hypothetical protein